MIYTVTLNPAVDKTVSIAGFQPGAVNRIGDSRVDAGGKGINVSRWIRAMGGQSVAIGIVGGETGRFIAQTLQSEGIDTDFAWVDFPTRTNLKIVDPRENITTDINEPGAPVGAQTLAHVFSALDSRADKDDIVVFSGKLPPGVEAKTLSGWVDWLRRKSVRVYADLEGDALAAVANCSPFLIKPNEHELSGLLGKPLHSLAETVNAAQSLLAGGLEQVVVTLGEKGVLFAHKNKENGDIWYAKGLPVQVQSTVGAGDATVAALAWADAAGMPPDVRMRLAVAAGAASVMQPSTGVAPPGLMERLMKQATIGRLPSMPG